MAAKTTDMSLLLLVSLLSLFTATTVATFINPLIIPSCSGQGKLDKCYQDYKAAYGAAHASSGKIGTADTTIVLAHNAVYAAKTSCSITLQFFKSFRGGSQRFITCEHTFNIAIIHLRKASFVSLWWRIFNIKNHIYVKIRMKIHLLVT